MNRDPFGPWPVAWRWLWVLLTGLVVFIQGPIFLRALRPSPDDHVSADEIIDFYQDWASARNVLDGLPVYTHHADSFERHLGIRLGPGEEIMIEHNAHPPSSVLLVLPFALLDYVTATLVWNLVSLAALAASLWIMKRQLGIVLSPWSALPLVTLLLTSNPFFEQLSMGQFNLVLLLLVTGSWAAARSGWPAWAGVLLGLATAFKLFPGFLFGYFLLRRQWKVVTVGLATFSAVSVLTIAVMGLEAYQSYLEEVVPSLSAYRASWVNASLAGFWYRLFDTGTGRPAQEIEMLWPSPWLARLGTWVSWAGLLALWAPVVWRLKTRSAGDHAFGLSLIAMLLLSPTTWVHYYLLLLLPLTLMWMHLPPSGLIKGLFLTLFLCLWLGPRLWCLALVPGLTEGVMARPWQSIAILSVQCYALLGLYVLDLAICKRTEEPVAASSPA